MTQLTAFIQEMGEQLADQVDSLDCLNLPGMGIEWVENESDELSEKMAESEDAVNSPNLARFTALYLVMLAYQIAEERNDEDDEENGE